MSDASDASARGVLAGKVALITGGGQGVGRGIALAFAAEGCDVALVGRRPGPLESTAAEVEARGRRALPIVCDVKVPDDIDRAVDATVGGLGGLHILVNNAQEVLLGPLLQMTDEAATASWESGPLATLRLMRRCHPHLRAGGVVINLGSGAGLMTNPDGFGVYGAVKEAIRLISRAAAREWGPDGIRVNVLIPLANSEGMVAWSESDPVDFQRVLDETALKRLGDCEADIGRAAVFLAGPDSSFISGTTLTVDGGQERLR